MSLSLKRFLFGLTSLAALTATTSHCFAEALPVGPDQEIRFNTINEQGRFVNSHCLFENAAGANSILSTELSSIVPKSGGLTRIACESVNGIYHGAVTMVPATDKSALSIISMPWTGMTALTEMASGGQSRSNSWSASAVVYPEVITIPMSMDNTVRPLPQAEAVSDELAVVNAPTAVSMLDGFSGPLPQPPRHRVTTKVMNFR